MSVYNEIVELLGQAIDKADNYLEYAPGGGMVGLPVPTRVLALAQGMAEVRQSLLDAYYALGGDDVWDDGKHKASVEEE